MTEPIPYGFDPSSLPRVGLGTSTDLFVEVKPRVAGVEHGRFYNQWIEATFRISTNPTPTFKTGISWEITFKTTDVAHGSEHDVEVFSSGFAETRRHAKAQVTDLITKLVQKVSAERKNPKKYAPLVKDESTLVVVKKPWWVRATAAILLVLFGEKALDADANPRVAAFVRRLLR